MVKDDFTITVTNAAAMEMKKLLTADSRASNVAIYLQITPGGCSGFSYSMNIDVVTEKTEELFEFNGVRFVINKFSQSYLDGVEIDFVSGLLGSGFTFNNPNSKGSCGCGSSFSV